MVHNDGELTDYDRLHHLRTAVTGDAFEKIEIFTVEENYHPAWNILLEAYENECNLISHDLTYFSIYDIKINLVIKV